MNDILKFFIGTSGVTILLIFLGKKIINSLAEVGLEKYKTELTKELFEFQKELEEKLEKFKISYSNLFVDQIVIIKEVYKRLILAEKPLEYLMRPIKISPTQKDEDLAKEVVEKANNFFNYFDENELMFSNETSVIFNQIRDKYIEVWRTFDKKSFWGANIPSDKLIKISEEMQKAYEHTLQGEIQALKKQLKKELQTQLGIIEREFSDK